MRRILRRLELVDDDWRYLGEDDAGSAAGLWLIVPSTALRTGAADARRLERLGVRVGAAERIEDLAPELPRLALVAFEFPAPGDGRGYTYARLLRERYWFTGEVRAVGVVKRDQLFFMARAGFDAFELSPGEELEGALQSLHTFTVAYQPGAPHAPVRQQRYFAQRSGSSTSAKS